MKLKRFVEISLIFILCATLITVIDMYWRLYKHVRVAEHEKEQKLGMNLRVQKRLIKKAAPKKAKKTKVSSYPTSPTFFFYRCPDSVL